MLNCGVEEYWDNLFESAPNDLNALFDEPANGFSTSPDSGCSFSMDDIERFLFNEDDFNNQTVMADEDDLNDQNIMAADEFFSDLFLDSPPEVVAEEDEKEDMPQHNGTIVAQAIDTIVDVVGESDPAAKKRKRQMRNRDAAMKSRERKKSLVKDLELKSKYYEAECKRLGMILQCCLAENQALRVSLHNRKAYDTSMTKQESAVLLLESLLLGSLLWFVGIMYLLIFLPSQLLLTLEAGLLEKSESREWGREAPRKGINEVFRTPALESFTMGKKCKGSRSRMKKLISMMSY